MFLPPKLFTVVGLLAASALASQAQAPNPSDKAGKHYVLPATKDTMQWG